MAKKNKDPEKETEEDTSSADDTIPKTEQKMSEGAEIVRNKAPAESDKPQGGMGILTTREIAKRYMQREPYLKLCLREMLIYLVFLVILGFLAAGQHGQSEYYLTRVMTKLFVETKFTSNGERVSYKKIKTLDQIWAFFDHVLYNTYWDYWYSYIDKVQLTKETEKYLLFENKLVGRPRVRQLRVRNDSCTVPKGAEHIIEDCFAEYSRSSEDTESYGFNNSTAWSYSSQEELGSRPINGEVSTYEGGGYYFDFKKTMEETNQIVKELMRGLWLDQGSRALLIQFTTYSGNENLFFTLQLLMEILPTGGVLASYKVHIHKFLLRDVWDFVPWGLTCVFVLFVILFTVEEIVEMIYFKSNYFNYFWNVLDLWILILSYLSLGFLVVSYILVQDEIKKLIGIIDKHAPFDTINNARQMSDTSLGVLFFFAAFKFVKYLDFNQSMNIVHSTFSKATRHIACFSIIFFVVFLSFAELGHLVFGGQVLDFRTLVDSMFALIRTLVGDLDYHQMKAANYFIGPAFFLAFIFFIYFIILVMFLAIIIVTYSEERSIIRDQRNDLQMWDVIMDWLGKLFKCCKRQPAQLTAHHQDMHNFLQMCGFTDVEIDLVFSNLEIANCSKEEMKKTLLSFKSSEGGSAEKKEDDDDDDADILGRQLLDRALVEKNNADLILNKIMLVNDKIDTLQNNWDRRRSNTSQ